MDLVTLADVNLEGRLKNTFFYLYLRVLKAVGSFNGDWNVHF